MPLGTLTQSRALSGKPLDSAPPPLLGSDLSAPPSGVVCPLPLPAASVVLDLVGDGPDQSREGSCTQLLHLYCAAARGEGGDASGLDLGKHGMWDQNRSEPLPFSAPLTLAADGTAAQSHHA